MLIVATERVGGKNLQYAFYVPYLGEIASPSKIIFHLEDARRYIEKLDSKVLGHNYSISFAPADGEDRGPSPDNFVGTLTINGPTRQVVYLEVPTDKVGSFFHTDKDYIYSRIDSFEESQTHNFYEELMREFAEIKHYGMTETAYGVDVARSLFGYINRLEIDPEGNSEKIAGLVAVHHVTTMFLDE